MMGEGRDFIYNKNIEKLYRYNFKLLVIILFAEENKNHIISFAGTNSKIYSAS